MREIIIVVIMCSVKNRNHKERSRQKENDSRIFKKFKGIFFADSLNYKEHKQPQARCQNRY